MPRLKRASKHQQLALLEAGNSKSAEFVSPSGRKIPKLLTRTIRELLEGSDSGSPHEFDFPRGPSLKSGEKKPQKVMEL